MGYRTTTDPQNGLITIHLQGVLVDADLLDLLATLRAIPNFAQYDQLVDCSEVVEFNVTTQGIRDYAARATTNSDGYDVNPERKIAIFAPSDLHYGLARVYAAHGEAIPAQIEVFKSAEELENWLPS